MIDITDLTPSGNECPGDFSGDFTLHKINSSYSDYEFEVYGLTDNPFNFWIPKSIAGTNIDYEVVAYWLMDQVELATDATNVSSLSQDIIFTLDNVNSGVATINVSGDYSCIKNDLISSIFYLTIQGVGDNEYDVEVPQSEAGNASLPSAGDVFRWLMKKLKEYACPECL